MFTRVRYINDNEHARYYMFTRVRYINDNQYTRYNTFTRVRYINNNQYARYYMFIRVRYSLETTTWERHTAVIQRTAARPTKICRLVELVHRPALLHAVTETRYLSPSSRDSPVNVYDVTSPYNCRYIQYKNTKCKGKFFYSSVNSP